MKLVLDEIAVVEKKDIKFLQTLPWYVIDELNLYDPYRDDLEVFYRFDSIRYWATMDVILDYKELTKTPIKKLEEKRNSVKRRLDAMAKDYLAATLDHKRALDRDYGRRQEKERLHHIYETLDDYLSNQEKYEEMFSRYLRK